MDFYLQEGGNHESIPNAKVTAEVQSPIGSQKTLNLIYDSAGKHYAALLPDQTSGEYKVVVLSEINGEKVNGRFTFNRWSTIWHPLPGFLRSQRFDLQFALHHTVVSVCCTHRPHQWQSQKCHVACSSRGKEGLEFIQCEEQFRSEKLLGSKHGKTPLSFFHILKDS